MARSIKLNDSRSVGSGFFLRRRRTMQVEPRAVHQPDITIRAPKPRPTCALRAVRLELENAPDISGLVRHVANIELSFEVSKMVIHQLRRTCSVTPSNRLE